MITMSDYDGPNVDIEVAVGDIVTPYRGGCYVRCLCEDLGRNTCVHL